MPKRALVLLVCGLALASCGGSGESEEDKVAEAIETWVASTDPADCKKLATLTFLEQTQSLEGPVAVDLCEEDAKEAKGEPKSVEVKSVTVKGPRATADASFTGGPFDGQGLSIALIEKRGEWKLDEITGFIHFDHDRMAAAYRQGTLEAGAGKLNPEVAPCVGEALAKISRPELEEVVLGGSPLPIEKLIERCL